MTSFIRPGVLLALPAAALALTACGRAGGGSTSVTTTIVRTVAPARTSAASAPAPAAVAGAFSPEAIYARDSPGVVTITATGIGGPTGEGVGSGFVVSPGGEIATNAHVVTSGTGAAIRPAGEVFVGFGDHNQVPARIVGFDPFTDVALLKVDPQGLRLRPLRLGSSTGLRIGAPVVAIGSPFGEDRSLSAGIISATGRAIQSLTGFATTGAIQTDAAVNQGNSGGPLLDADGRVLGINSQIASSSGGGSGVGFAVPVDAVRRSLSQLRLQGRPKYAYLGLATAPVYPQLARQFGLKTRSGAWVQTVIPGGPAAAAGLRAGNGTVRFQARDYVPGGDVIVALDGRPVRDEADLSKVIGSLRPGARARVRIVRAGSPRTLSMTLGERPLGGPPGG
ncbi:MAG TPA: trypsin-like peptidase domain-containing protein [Solirubrobacteraceae bacterium]